MQYEDLRRKLREILGTTPDVIVTTEKAARIQEFVDRERELFWANQRVRAEHRKQEAYYARTGAFFAGLLESRVPPPRPVRDVFGQALEDLHLGGHAGCDVDFGGVQIDFAYDRTRLAIRIAEDPAGDAILEANGWEVLRFSEGQIRRDATACASQVAKVYRTIESARR